MVEVQDKLTPVDAHFTGTCAGSALFTLMPLRDDDNVVMGVRFDQLFSGKYLPVSFPHYMRDGEKITFDETNTAEFMRDTLLELRAVCLELDMLQDEYHSTSDTARYNELKDPHGPIRTLKRKRDALKTVYTLTFHETMGFWPGQLRDMGIN